MLLQGNMPSQQAHIIKNTFEPGISPWFSDTFPQGKLVLATWGMPFGEYKAVCLTFYFENMVITYYGHSTCG